MRVAGSIGAAWSIAGVTLLLGSAIERLAPRITDAFRIGLTPLMWTILGLWCLFMLVAEGYRGFQQQFAPRVAARTWYLAQHGRVLDLLLAPLYSVGYYHASRRRVITSWSLTSGIVLLIIVVSHVAQPWRGIIDTGVLLGLVYGLACVYIFTARTFVRRQPAELANE
jgi:hypothetical protein